MWQSLIDSVSDYLPSHSGAPLLLPVSSSSFSGTSDTSDETDSAVVIEDTSAPNNISSSSNNPEDPMEGLLAIQTRVKKAQASGVVLLDKIVDLIARGENIRDEANEIAVLSPSGDFMNSGRDGAEKRISWTNCGSLLARMNCTFCHLSNCI